MSLDAFKINKVLHLKEQASLPASAENGDMVHQGGTVFLRKGGSWVDMGSSGGGLTQREAAADPSPAIINSSYLITGAFGTFTLPTIGSDGEILYLKRGASSDFDGTPMTITPDGAETVGGDATLVWDDADVDLIILTSNGTDWEVTTTISPSATIATESKLQRKTLTGTHPVLANTNTPITELTFNNLVIGQAYEISYGVGIGNGDPKWTWAQNGTQYLGPDHDTPSNPSNRILSGCESFIATATTLEIYIYNVTNAATVLVSTTANTPTFARLRSIPGGTTTTDWT